MTPEGSNFIQMVSNLKGNGMVSINTKVVYRHFLSDFRPLQPCFGLRRNNANLLGKCGRLVLLGLVPNTTKNFQNYYGGILWDLKNNIRPQTLNSRIRNSF